MIENVNAYALLGLFLAFAGSASFFIFCIYSLSKKLTKLARDVEIYKGEIQLLYRSQQASDVRLEKFKTELDNLRLDVDTRELHASTTSVPYQQAIKLAKKGNGVEDLMEACDISKAEAELIVMFHGAREETRATH